MIDSYDRYDGRYEWFDDLHDEIYNSDGCNDINSVDYNIEESDDVDDDDNDDV